MTLNAERIPGQGIKQARLGGRQVVPGDGADERAQEERDQVERLELFAPRAIRARVDPGERHAKEGGEQHRPRADEQCVDKCARYNVVGIHQAIVVQPPGGAEPQIVEDPEAAHDQRRQRKQDSRGHDQAYHDGRDRLLRDQAPPAAY